jgi:DNA polymerase-3 subunit delta'
MVVSPASRGGQIGIDQIRSLAHGLALTPYEGRRKVGLIEEADALTEEAAHACLRLLEEPPERSYLILIAAQPHRLPATVVSRCHRVPCAPQGIQRVAAALEERERLDPVLATLLATWSGGRLGCALEFHRRERLLAKNSVVNQLLDAWKEQRLEVPLTAAPRTEILEALEWLVAWCRDLLVLRLQGDTTWLMNQDRMDDLKMESSLRPCSTPPGPSEAHLPSSTVECLERLLRRLDRIYGVHEAVQRNASPRIALAALLCRE